MEIIIKIKKKKKKWNLYILLSQSLKKQNFGFCTIVGILYKDIIFSLKLKHITDEKGDFLYFIVCYKR